MSDAPSLGAAARIPQPALSRAGGCRLGAHGRPDKAPG
ncbi:hypothetical protein BSLA_02r2589 [Burkholderia stabilis]|nr:hypothetical protein BSLA_02r2589 [Burkholderia stabilis]